MEGVTRVAGLRAGGLTISRQAGQGALGLRPAVFELSLDRILVAGYLT